MTSIQEAGVGGYCIKAFLGGTRGFLYVAMKITFLLLFYGLQSVVLRCVALHYDTYLLLEVPVLNLPSSLVPCCLFFVLTVNFSFSRSMFLSSFRNTIN